MDKNIILIRHVFGELAVNQEELSITVMAPQYKTRNSVEIRIPYHKLLSSLPLPSCQIDAVLLCPKKLLFSIKQ